MEYFTTRLFLKTIQCRLFGATDRERWKNVETFDPAWSERSRLIGQLVPPNSRVFEFGAGSGNLRYYIPQTCIYFASDAMDRGGNFLTVDLNSRPLPDLNTLKLDIAIFAGVLEYVIDLPNVIRWLSKNVTACIASYEPANTLPRTFARLQETLSRASVGWMNCYDKLEFVDLFQTNGFRLTRTVNWESEQGEVEPIFVFQCQIA